VVRMVRPPSGPAPHDINLQDAAAGHHFRTRRSVAGATSSVHPGRGGRESSGRSVDWISRDADDTDSGSSESQFEVGTI
jgi:hypothetical protein